METTPENDDTVEVVEPKGPPEPDTSDAAAGDPAED